MKLRNVICALVLAICASGLLEAIATGNCIPLQKSEPTYPIEQGFSALIKGGDYCLNQDVSQRRHLLLGHAGFAMSDHRGSFVPIAAPNVTVDFQNFLVRSTAENRRLISNSLSNDDIKNIQLRNGRVVLDKSIGVKLDGGDCERRLPKKICETNFLIENLDLFAKATAIQMSGAGNTVKSSRIQSKILEKEEYFAIDGGIPKASISLTGPNNIVENSIIFYDGSMIDNESTAIQLIDGDNTVIRNNIIVLIGMDSRRPLQAITIRNSKNVVLENNRVYGADALYKLFDDKSSVKDSENALQALSKQPRLSGGVRKASDVQ